MKPENVKIIQITAVVENQMVSGGEYRADTIEPCVDATVYGLGDDSRLYWWTEIKSTRIDSEPSDENDWTGIHYEKEYGWKESGK